MPRNLALLLIAVVLCGCGSSTSKPAAQVAATLIAPPAVVILTASPTQAPTVAPTSTPAATMTPTVVAATAAIVAPTVTAYQAAVHECDKIVGALITEELGQLRDPIHAAINAVPGSSVSQRQTDSMASAVAVVKADDQIIQAQTCGTLASPYLRLAKETSGDAYYAAASAAAALAYLDLASQQVGAAQQDSYFHVNAHLSNVTTALTNVNDELKRLNDALIQPPP